MKNLEVNCWSQEGEIFLWSYPESGKNYAGWHITGTDEGALSIVKLLTAFEADGVASFRTVKTSRPTTKILSIPGCRQKAKWAESLIFEFTEHTKNGTGWMLRVESGKAIISFQASKLAELRGAFEGIPKGEGDYRLMMEDTKAPSLNALWFWWHL